tara:strand:+ start:101 stop:589 length:489 start_codon:yes stop_codon:yes gene_type:complete
VQVSTLHAGMIAEMLHVPSEKGSVSPWAVTGGKVSMLSTDGSLQTSYVSLGYRFRRDMMLRGSLSPEEPSKYHSVDVHYVPEYIEHYLKLYQYASLGYTVCQGAEYDVNFDTTTPSRLGVHFGLGAYVALLDDLWLTFGGKYVYTGSYKPRILFHFGLTFQP